MLQELFKQAEMLQAQIKSQVDADSESLLTKADNMAECASNMQGQGYSSFINAREEFINELDRIKNNYLKLVNPNFLYTSTRQKVGTPP